MKGIIVQSQKQSAFGKILGEDKKIYRFNLEFSEKKKFRVEDLIEYSIKFDTRYNFYCALIHFNYSEEKRRLKNLVVPPLGLFSLERVLNDIEVFLMVADTSKIGGDTKITNSYFLINKFWDPYIQSLIGLNFVALQHDALVKVSSYSENLGYSSLPKEIEFNKKIRNESCTSYEFEIRNKIKENYNAKAHSDKLKELIDKGDLFEFPLMEYYD